MSLLIPGRLAGMALMAALAAACGSSSDNSNNDNGGDGGDGGTSLAVTVSNNTFSPASLTVPVGSTVTWTWANGASNHNVIGDDGANPPSSGAPSNAPHSYAFTFSTAGTFRYHCGVHGAAGGSGMAGTIIAQ